MWWFLTLWGHRDWFGPVLPWNWCLQCRSERNTRQTKASLFWVVCTETFWYNLKNMKRRASLSRWSWFNNRLASSPPLLFRSSPLVSSTPVLLWSPVGSDMFASAGGCFDTVPVNYDKSKRSNYTGPSDRSSSLQSHPLDFIYSFFPPAVLSSSSHSGRPLITVVPIPCIPL